MNKKKVAAILSAGILSTSAFAFATDTSNATISAQNNSPRHEKTLTAEEKAQFEQRKAQMDSANEKWKSLSQSQKNEVYKIDEEIVKLEKEKLDKLVSLGVIDRSFADEKKTKLDQRLAETKSSGSFSFGKGKGGRDGRPRGQNNTSTNSSKTN